MKWATILFLKTMFLGIVTLSVGSVCSAQISFSEKEALANVTNDTIQNEISSFSVTRSLSAQKHNISNAKLRELPIWKCSESFIHFASNSPFGNEMIVEIDADTGHAVKTVSAVRFAPHGRKSIYLPANAIAGIYDPIFCKGNKEKRTDCKVMRSKDNKRVYIYMINGSGENRYEVTWIIKSGKYYGRIVNKVPN